MIRQFMEDAHAYLTGIENPSEEQAGLLKSLENCYDLFPITSVSREDLAGKGFITERIYDGDMTELASKMADDYCEQLFWESMVIIAEDSLDLPRKPVCPKCGEANGIEKEKGKYGCPECGHTWTEEFADDEDEINE